MRDYECASLIHDPLHGYIPFTTNVGLAADEVSERQLIDHPWVQRMRQIHQLQTAWYVYPSAEHSRFQHILGVMHLASRAAAALYPSLQQVCPDVPSEPYVESLLRMAGLLHDVGHGPFGHFFDEHYLSDYGLTHETLGATIIEQELGDLLRGLRRNPNGRFQTGEQIDPAQITYLITRPASAAGQPDQPRWLTLLRSLFSGLYTVDNLDFVLRDSYMSGLNLRAFDLDRLLYYSFFTRDGLTIHDRGISALIHFLEVKAELFRSVYFHREVRALDLALKDLFESSKKLLFPGDPRKQLDEYLHFTEWSLLVDVARWSSSGDPAKRALGPEWQRFLRRDIRWKWACQATVTYGQHDSQKTSVFSRPEFVEQQLRAMLPAGSRNMPLRVDLPRHFYRPGTFGPAGGQNFLFDPATRHTRPLSDHELIRRSPVSYTLCRVYVEEHTHDAELGAALRQLLGPEGGDDKTNM
jgi:HD superfamily phosphohydrolase